MVYPPLYTQGHWQYGRDKADYGRSITYSFRCGEQSYKLIITQNKFPQLQSDNDFIWVMPAGGIVEVEYSTKMNYEAVINEGVILSLKGL